MGLICRRAQLRCLAPEFCRTLGGGPLLGTKLVRMTFIDEGGTSQSEPFYVVQPR
jgi:hypothetical protein